MSVYDAAHEKKPTHATRRRPPQVVAVAASCASDFATSDFATSRVDSEWFRDCPAIRDLIASAIASERQK